MPKCTCDFSDLYPQHRFYCPSFSEQTLEQRLFPAPEPTADEMEEWDYERRQKLARDLEY